MRTRRSALFVVVSFSIALVAAVAQTGFAAAQGPPAPQDRGESAQHVPVCGPAPKDSVRCHAIRVDRFNNGMAPCTTANGCFKKVNQSGQTSPLPAVDGGWAQEISLDLDMVSATCPNCHILLVEGNSSSIGDLAQAVRTASALGANAISNSY